LLTNGGSEIDEAVQLESLMSCLQSLLYCFGEWFWDVNVNTTCVFCRHDSSDFCNNCRLLYRCEIVIGQRIRLTVSRMVMECFVKALYVVLISVFSGFSLPAEREREREMEENSKCFLLMCLLKVNGRLEVYNLTASGTSLRG
ncbi:hypothetical protein T07_5016, partial [Trichinella nelsoni]